VHHSTRALAKGGGEFAGPRASRAHRDDEPHFLGKNLFGDARAVNCNSFVSKHMNYISRSRAVRRPACESASANWSSTSTMRQLLLWPFAIYLQFSKVHGAVSTMPS
jgi:hypothetical protein